MAGASIKATGRIRNLPLVTISKRVAPSLWEHAHTTSNGFSELIANAVGGRGSDQWTLKANADNSIPEPASLLIMLAAGIPTLLRRKHI